MRVFHVILTKEFDVTVLAKSENELLDALDDCQREIDNDWDPPEWDFDIRDTLNVKDVNRLPKKTKFDMVVVDGTVYSAQETGSVGKRIVELEAEAEEELAKQRLKLGIEAVQVKLPFEEKIRWIQAK